MAFHGRPRPASHGTPRFALLTPDENVELLPATAEAADVGLQEGHYYRCKVAPGVQLYWKQSPLSWLANPGASALCGTHVCGDAVLSLLGPFGSELEVQELLASLLSRASPRGQALILPPGSPSGAAAGPSTWAKPQWPLAGQGGSAGGPRGELAAAAEGQSTGQGPPAAVPSSAPPPPLCEPATASLGSSPAAAMGGEAPAAAAAAAAAAPAPARPAAQGAAGGAASPSSAGDEFEPRQQLLWAIASRATSISWAPPTPVQSSELPGGTGAGGGGSSEAARLDAGGSSGGRGSGGAQGAEVAAPGGGPGEEAAGECAASCCGSDDGHARGWAPWGSARPEILALIVEQAGYSAAFARLLGAVCAGWRQGLREERQMLRQLRFLRCSPEAAAAAAPANSCRRRAAGRSAGPLPWLVVEAARVGNVSAAVVAARHLEAQRPHPPPTEVSWFWFKAAKRGHPEAQAKVGLSYYKGSLGLAVDCEEAMLWLSRAAKQLTERTAGPAAAGSAGAGAAAEPGAAAEAVGAGVGAGAPVAPPLLMTAKDCRQCLAQVALIIGLLHLDGEGTKQDVAAGIKWLKVAEQHGCMEAGLVLGSLYNTGQYG